MKNEKILNLICCPNCQGKLEQEKKDLICQNCGAKFYEKEGILVLISKELEDELRYG